MAFRKLIEGDCGQENALSHIAGHFTQDIGKTEKVHYSQVPLEFQSHPNADQLVQEFMQETMAVPQTFRMDNLLEEMREIENQHHMMGPIIGPSVKETLHLEEIGNKETDHIWAKEYLSNGSAFNETVASNTQIWSNAQNNTNKSENFELGFGPQWAEQYLSHQPIETSEQEQFNKSKLGDEDELAATAGAVVQTLEGDPGMQYSKFVKFMQQLENKEVLIEDGKVSEPSSSSAIDLSLDDKWVEEFTKSAALKNATPEADTSAQFWQSLEDNWKKLSEEEHDWLSFNDDPIHQNYKFATTNPMSEIENSLGLGKEKLASYDIPSAVLCFEAACQKDPENSEAWLMLGMAQAENEQDPLAIQALEQCLRIDPTNLKALQALAISQTNENFQSQACNTLIRWIQNHPKYSHLVTFNVDNTTRNVTSFMSENQFQTAEDLLIKAVNIDRSTIDENVQTCLGVLFCLSSEYDKAVDCFNTALQVKPDDPRLWNRVGAALANNNKSEDAVAAYRHALELNPGFIRARYNLGIACINLKSYNEAAEHFIEALNQQAKIQQQLTIGDNVPKDVQRIMSDAIWMTLRTCCNMMGRQDLRPMLDVKDLNGLAEALHFTYE